MTLDQLFDRTIPEPNSGCWLWTGALCSGGYAMLHKPGTKRDVFRVHRLSYKLANGSIDDDLQVDHLCRIRSCINPDHLEAVTQTENVMRGIGFAAENSRKIFCDKGHEFTAENTRFYKRKDGGQGRRCRQCHRDHERQYRIARNDKFRS